MLAPTSVDNQESPMPATLSLNAIRKNCAKFAHEWSDCVGDEKQDGHEFMRELMQCFGITKRKAISYERRSNRASTGRQGYIDALIPGKALIEMKSAGKNLDEAEEQALDYIHDLADVETPRLLIISDFRRIRIVDLDSEKASDGSGDAGRTEFRLTQLPDHVDDLKFLAGYGMVQVGSREQEEASIRAARVMADLYEALDGSGYRDHEASIFLIRTLFCLYGDDAGLWERDLFTEFLVTRTREDGSDLGAQLTLLYQTMNTPVEHRQSTLDELIARFPYVNGGIFAEHLNIPSFSSAMRDELMRACAFDWSGISPAVFGSLFQAVKSPEARRELGEHYTSETNILKTLEPLFLDELHQKFADHVHDTKELKALRQELGELRIMDPACGCGNFLVVAYRELRRLDTEILVRIRELELARKDNDEFQATMFFDDRGEHAEIMVQLDHFFGIEIEEWPARIAQTALHLAHHQANREMERLLGQAPSILPLSASAHITIGNALRTDWTQVCPPSPTVRIVGNPPFIGQYMRSEEQTDDLRFVWGDGYDGYLDYVTGWFIKASQYFQSVPRGGRFGFVSTNSIAQGTPVAALFRPLLEGGWRIQFAHQTFAWTSEAPGAAAVHCVITGFDRGAPHEKARPVLFTYSSLKAQPEALPVKHINPYLVEGPDIFLKALRHPLSPNLPEVRFGSKPVDGGNLIVEAKDYPQVAADPIAAKYLRPFRMGREVVRGLDRWCLWMHTEDFDPRDIDRSPILKERVRACAIFRQGSKKKATVAGAQTAHLFQENHQPSEPYVAIPRVVSETRLFYTAAHLSEDVIAGDKVYTALDPDGFLFAIISSSMFMSWQKLVGGRLKSDLNFSNKIVWNTLPLPEVSDKQRAAIIAAGQGVMDARAEQPDVSLADMYNPLAMAPSLLKAHRVLDRAVDRAFGARKALETNEERLAILFKRYQEMTATEN
ncbi:DNA methyltransferase [uncultured Actinomyces sp.]|uniref:DNA methyltransferase n=1 Tax=uncultured Actinomyces sp. TaxID=249061 RepID=UPI0028E9DFD1|nr:DNA methyltransferase [uncultured Actinomyces sp.]